MPYIALTESQIWALQFVKKMNTEKVIIIVIVNMPKTL